MSDQRPAPGTRLKILLVEASTCIQEILTEFLQTVPGLELAGVVATATDALAAFESHRPDVVILDIALRVGSGLDVLHEIKQRAPACRVLVFTVYDEEPFRTRCLAAGADHFFSKIRQHRELIQHLHNLGGDALAATGQPADAGPSDSADFSHLCRSHGNSNHSIPNPPQPPADGQLLPHIPCLPKARRRQANPRAGTPVPRDMGVSPMSEGCGVRAG